MDLYSIKNIKALLKEHNAAPKEGLGQNFLLKKSVAAKMLTTAELSLKDTVLEIGPGIGTLTKELATKAGRVIAIEKDPVMLKILKQTTKEFFNIDILQGDILKESSLDLSKFKVVSNLPYYIASPVVRMFLEADNKPELMVVMVQKEVAQRICAKPSDMNLLAVSVQFYSTPKIISFVSKGAFWPRPKVDSAILKLTPSKEKLPVAPDKFFLVVKAGFRQPRKQLVNNLSGKLSLARSEAETWLEKNNIAPTQRAETLSLQDWINLARSLS
jgi:16S rRNA (adenine1518-N6/adenine1519-N6)-dimethyltransferase